MGKICIFKILKLNQQAKLYTIRDVFEGLAVRAKRQSDWGKKCWTDEAEEWVRLEISCLSASVREQNLLIEIESLVFASNSLSIPPPS